MPPRGQKRKLDDSPYATGSGFKRTAGPSNGLYSRDQRDGSVLPGTTRDAYYGFDKDQQANKRRKAEGGVGYYPAGATREFRGEEGPLITLDLSTLPHSAILKYLQTYNLVPIITPSPISYQRPATPASTILKSPEARRPPYKSYWEDTGELKNKVSNGSMLGLSGAAALENGVPNAVPGGGGMEEEKDHLAYCDVDAAKDAFMTIAQNHWNSMSASKQPVGNMHGFVGNGLVYGNGPRISERDIIDDFMNNLRAKELSVRLST